MNKLNTLLTNSRFYILVNSVLLSIFFASYVRATIPSDQLYYIRLEQIFGLVSIFFLYTAVILTPTSKLVGKKPWIQKLLFARRAIGVSAAYFALLHVYLVMAEQISGFGGLALLPTRFKVSFVLGTIALIILLLMAATSFDKAISLITFKRWKQLHRYVYLAGLVVIVHVWLIGTHAEKSGIRLVSFIALAILFTLEAKRISHTFSVRRKLSRAWGNIVFLVLTAAMLGSIALLPILTKNYHSEHHDQSGQEHIH